MSSFFESLSTIPIGYIVISVILIPIIVMAIAGIATKPRNFAVPAVFTGAVVLLIGGMLAGLVVIGFLLKFIVPQ